MRKENRVKKGQLELNGLYMVSIGGGTLYKYVSDKLLERKTFILEPVITEQSTGREKKVQITTPDLVKGKVIHGLKKGDVCTGLKGELLYYQGYANKSFYFIDSEGNQTTQTFAELAEGNGVLIGYEEKKKTEREKKKEVKREVNDFGKPISGAKKNWEIYRSASTKQLKELPKVKKVEVAKKSILYDTEAIQKELETMTDRRCAVLKKMIWDTIPDAPSATEGVNTEFLLDEYFEYVRTVWGDNTAPKSKYTDFTKEGWHQVFQDNMIMDGPMVVYPPYNYYNAHKAWALDEYMEDPAKIDQYILDKGLMLDSKQKWRKNYGVYPLDVTSSHFLIDEVENILTVIEPKTVRRYRITQDIHKEGIPSNGTWVVVSRKDALKNMDDLSNGLVTMTASSEHEAWEIARAHYEGRRTKPKRKKTQLIMELESLERIPLKGVKTRPENKNVTEAEFEKIFAGWGGVFGQSQTSPVRHEYLNLTFDGLQDMFYALEMETPKDVCFHGDLSFGFGSHGAGICGARYHPYLEHVISLTTKRGKGLFGLTWMTALNYIAGEKLGYGCSLTNLYNMNPSGTPKEISDLMRYLLKGDGGESRMSEQARYIGRFYMGRYTTLESLFSYAGGAYLLDKFRSKGMRNDFVNGLTEFTTQEGYRLTPEGHEREKVNMYFENMMQYLKREGVFSK